MSSDARGLVFFDEANGWIATASVGNTRTGERSLTLPWFLAPDWCAAMKIAVDRAAAINSRVHPDAPDDADLIDDLARSLADAWHAMQSWGHPNNVPDADFIDLARKVIERVRAAQ